MSYPGTYHILIRKNGRYFKVAVLTAAAKSAFTVAAKQAVSDASYEAAENTNLSPFRSKSRQYRI